MVNHIVFEYLKEHKDKYNLDDLKREILAKGYTEEEYYEALKMASSKKLKGSDVSKLPHSNVVKEKKKGSFFKFFIILILVLLLGCGVIVLLNYLSYPVFGFNVFDYF